MVEGEYFGSHLCEAGGLKQVGDLAGGGERNLPRGSWAASWEAMACVGRESPAQVWEPLRRCRPEHDGVDGEDGVKRAVERGQHLSDGAQRERGSSGLS